MMKSQKSYRAVAAVLILVVVGLVGWYVYDTKNDTGKICSQISFVSHGGPVCDYVSFIDNLRAKGATVEPISEISDPAFSVKGQQIKVDGENAHVYEYENSAAAKKDLSSDTKIVDWEPGTRLYQKEKLVVVLNSGSSQKLISLLSSVLGNPILPSG